jgi:hypothetical protein
MDVLKMANAVVHFRMLRSLGRFQPTGDPQVFQFHPCTCGRMESEALPNGLPDPVSSAKVRDIIDRYTHELGLLCRQHYS